MPKREGLAPILTLQDRTAIIDVFRLPDRIVMLRWPRGGRVFAHLLAKEEA